MTFDQRPPDRWNGSCQAMWPVALAAAQVTVFIVVLILWPRVALGLVLVLAAAPLILAFRRLDLQAALEHVYPLKKND